MSLDLWELAKKKVAEKKTRTEEGDGMAAEYEEGGARVRDETTIIVCGGKNSGKTSIMMRFLDKNETAKPSTALEYIYARRMRGSSKQLCHLWEVAGGSRLSNLLSIPITKKVITSASLVIVVDLMKPHEIRPTVEVLLESGRRQVDKALKQLNADNPAEYDAFMAEQKDRLATNKELSMCAPFPIPLAILGSKYDEFQNREVDERRKICKLLRFLAHYYGAILVFHSSRMETTLAKGRLLFAHLGFGAQMGRTSQTDLNKPLFVPCAADSFADIGPPPSNDSSYSSLRASQPIDLWWAVFSESFPTIEQKQNVVDPTVDPLFAEPALDAFIEQKKRDLEMYIRQKKERQAAEERATEKLKIEA